MGGDISAWKKPCFWTRGSQVHAPVPVHAVPAANWKACMVGRARNRRDTRVVQLVCIVKLRVVCGKRSLCSVIVLRRDCWTRISSQGEKVPGDSPCNEGERAYVCERAWVVEDAEERRWEGEREEKREQSTRGISQNSETLVNRMYVF